MNRDEKSLYFHSLSSVFPACAGVILKPTILATLNCGVPRMCGGDPIVCNPLRRIEMCSPHVRG